MAMTLRERLLTGLRGGKPDRIPWSIYAWLLPETPAAHELHAKGLGLMGAARIFRPVYTDVAIAETRKTVDGRTYITTRIETPVGTLVQKSATESGYGTAYIRKYFISDPEDYSIADFVCKHTSFEPIFRPWYEADAQMGDGGIVIGEIMPIPILELMVAWMGTQGLAEGIYLYRDRFDALIHALDRHYDRHIEFAADCPAEIIWFPDNVTGSIISPKLFERYCAPSMRAPCRSCAPQERYLLPTMTARTGLCCSRWPRQICRSSRLLRLRRWAISASQRPKRPGPTR